MGSLTFQHPFAPNDLCKDGKEFTCNVGDLSSIPELGRCPGGGHGNLPQYSDLKNSMYRRAWLHTVHGVTKSQTQLTDFHFISVHFSSIANNLGRDR